MDAIKAGEVVESILEQGNKALSDHFNADVIAISAPMTFGVDDMVKNEIENMNEAPNEEHKEKLVVVLETDGGYVEVVERIVSVFRNHYQRVEFIIPNYAYSAGTVLALSGDDIHMNYYSVLGPIDPQFSTEKGRRVPGMGYIAKYKSLINVINSTPDDQIANVKAEMALLLQKFDPAEVFQIEQSIKHSQELLEKWLPEYKFRDWVKTETGRAVTPDYRKERATRIAQVLGNAEHWHSHGRGISMNELRSDAIGLKINDFGENTELRILITHYHGLLSDYMSVNTISSAIHTPNRLRRLG
jgi:Serine dehydrogenase proteinase